MGKSPGKWIKTLLFGKKANKSHLSKGREVLTLKTAANETETWVAAKAPGADFSVDPPSISRPAPGKIDRNGGNSELEKGVPSNLPHDREVLPQNQDTDKQGITGSGAPNDPEIIRREKAATKAQAAFRGYLARRAFRALKGIIRLQALVRGHLVRRQAVATLRCMQRIVKLQALVRGRRVRLSDTGLEVRNKCNLSKPLESQHLEIIGVNVYTWTEKLSANAFVIKLLASSSSTLPLHVQYGLDEPNSAWSWLERWTFSRFWKPLSQPKKFADSKSQARQGIQTAETEPGRSKRSVRRVPSANLDNGSIHSTSESEKPKRNLRKVLSHPVDSEQENPQNELERVKRNLRKVSSSTTEASDRLEVENEKSKLVVRKMSSSPAPDVSDQCAGDSAEKTNTDAIMRVSKQPDIVTTAKPLTSDEPVAVLHDDHLTVKLQPLESCEKDENIPVKNGDLISKEDQASNENQKTSKRRASFPAKQEYPENGLQNTTPTLPSYMAATESAKAKLRGQGSPRFGQDGAEKDGFSRRHSLPSSNGKLSSQSPRTQKPFQAGTKKGIRERSLLSSRDDKVVQAEWRR